MTEEEFLEKFLAEDIVVNCSGRMAAEDFLYWVSKRSDIKTRSGEPLVTLVPHARNITGYHVRYHSVSYINGGYDDFILPIVTSRYPLPAICWWTLPRPFDAPQEFDEQSFQALLGV